MDRKLDDFQCRVRIEATITEIKDHPFPKWQPKPRTSLEYLSLINREIREKRLKYDSDSSFDLYALKEIAESIRLVIEYLESD